ncbi:hypothetical protein Q8F55_000358 [Vanrija albida]|uniref:Uncharacterized protein n=1 Tax=Vanrija albida TaxID=181172 RepID=A0ABR3QD16_9TREE
MLHALTDSRKSSRSNSTSSVASAASSHSPDDIYARLVRRPDAALQLWSAGNLRVGGRDLAVSLADVVDLAQSLHDDERFELLSIVYLGTEGDEWKASYRLNSQPSTPASSAGSIESE